MDKKLIPIIASYWGNTCSYVKNGQRIKMKIREYFFSRLLKSGHNHFEDFKIHLKRLEMDEDERVKIERTYYFIHISEVFAPTVNMLRREGYCVDNELIENDLVFFVD